MQQPIGRGLDLDPVLGDLVGIEKVEDVGLAIRVLLHDGTEGLPGAPGGVSQTVQNAPLGLGDVTGGDVGQDGQDLVIHGFGGQMATHGGQNTDAGKHGLRTSGVDGEVLVGGDEGAVPVGMTSSGAVGLATGIGDLEHDLGVSEQGLQGIQVLGAHDFSPHAEMVFGLKRFNTS